MSRGMKKRGREGDAVPKGGNASSVAPTAGSSAGPGSSKAGTLGNGLGSKTFKWNWEVGGICALLVILVLAVFGQTASFKFVDLDDGACVYANPVVSKGLAGGAIGWAFTHCQVGHWDPLTTLSHMTVCEFCGTKPWGHHLTNVVLLAGAAVLLFLLLVKMTGAMWRSGLAAAVWAIHPLRAESVAWVTERKDVLSGLFFMLTLLGYGWYARRPESRLRYAAVMVCFALGLMSKSMLVTLPFVLLLLDYWPLRRFEDEVGGPDWGRARQLWMEKAPLLLLSMILAVVQLKVNPAQPFAVEKVPLMPRIGNAIVSYVVYLRQMLWPVDLAPLYPFRAESVRLWEVALAVAGLGAMSAMAICWRKRQPWLFVGWVWYVGMLTPVIGVVQSGILAAHADRYMYLPQIGLCIAGTWAAADWAGERRHRRAMVGGIAVAALGVMSIVSYHQATFWRDSITLWTHTVKSTQDNTIAHYCLGTALLRQGGAEEAAAQYREALRTDPDFEQAHNNLGNILLMQGQTGDAIVQYRAVLRIDQSNALAHNNLGEALYEQGQSTESIIQTEKAVELDPGTVSIQNHLAWILATVPETALRNGPRALQLARKANESTGGKESDNPSLAGRRLCRDRGFRQCHTSGPKSSATGRGPIRTSARGGVTAGNWTL